MMQTEDRFSKCLKVDVTVRLYSEVSFLLTNTDSETLTQQCFFVFLFLQNQLQVLFVCLQPLALPLTITPSMPNQAGKPTVSVIMQMTAGEVWFISLKSAFRREQGVGWTAHVCAHIL